MKKRAAAVAAALLLAPAAFADTLIDNVNGYTLDRQGALVRFTGLVIDDGDGTVKQLLARKDKRPDRPSYRLDGKGRTLIPGMIDAHGDVMELGFLTLQLDLRGTASLAEAQAKIAAYAAANPSPRWIVGFGWDQEKWGLGRFPTAAELDAAVADRPVWLQRVDGHAGWANSAALAEAGVGAASPSPPGGRIEKSGKQPSGVFVDAAMALVQKAVPAPLPRVRDQALANAQALLLGLGITSVADMGTDTDGWMVMRRAGDRGALHLRIISYGLGVDTALAVAGTGPTPWLYGGRLRMVGVKLSADGALGSRGAWLKTEYRDAPGLRGAPFHNDAELKNLMSRAAMDHFQLAVDAVGDAANAQLLDAIDELSGTYDGDRRWRIEHAEIVDPADLPRFGRHGIVASMQPTLAASGWQMAEARLGTPRLAGADAWASMLQNHVPLAFGSNFPAESPNPFAGLAAAVSREDAEGRPAGGWLPQQKLTLAQAFAAFTRGGAYAAFEENRLGTLERGRMADFLFIDRDIFADGMTPQAIRGTTVLETWVGGRKEWAKGAAVPDAIPPKPRGNEEHR
ncbi:MAG TPA: amidohydrolase [Allosphingosinicella sp.]|nr:amidohydrolase [Allosphingosinicella sp.]